MNRSCWAQGPYLDDKILAFPTTSLFGSGLDHLLWLGVIVKEQKRVPPQEETNVQYSPIGY
jgi:hypothetical protein